MSRFLKPTSKTKGESRNYTVWPVTIFSNLILPDPTDLIHWVQAFMRLPDGSRSHCRLAFSCL